MALTSRPSRLGGPAALAPHQVSKADVASFRSSAKHDDQALVTLASWAAMAAARAVGSWLREQAPDQAGQP